MRLSVRRSGSLSVFWTYYYIIMKIIRKSTERRRLPAWVKKPLTYLHSSRCVEDFFICIVYDWWVYSTYQHKYRNITHIFRYS
jgi:hypothetical protein